ncbi:MAG: NAD(P)/FAD-dependent oxidoreductase [Wenzhouxiangella sp.]
MSRIEQRWPGLSWYESRLAGQDSSEARGPSSRPEGRYPLAVIGAGLAGVSAAFHAQRLGLGPVALFEAGQVGAGASGRNGGFVFAGYSLGPEALIARVGQSAARRLHGWTRAAVQQIRNQAEVLSIDCQLNPAGVVLADWFDDPSSLETLRQRWLDALDFELLPVPRDQMWARVRSPRYGGGLFEPGSFHFNPLAYVQGLAGVFRQEGGEVFEHCPVQQLEKENNGWRLETARGSVVCDRVVLATGGYDQRLFPRVQRALQPIATYIAVTEPLNERLTDVLPGGVAVYDNRFAFDYYRPLPERRLLWGGRISVANRSPAAIRRLLRADLARVFPDLSEVEFDHAWGGWMSYARHQMPLLGQTERGLFHALAFGGHGMAPTTLAGQVIAEALAGDSTRLNAFQPWQPRWAGGLVGRLVVQLRYWSLQARDWYKAR